MSSSFQIFQTIVAIDLETTGFLDPEISEIAIIAIPFDLLSDINAVRRVGNKLVICLDPQRDFEPAAEKITGLNKINLNGFSNFGCHTLRLLDTFFRMLPKPIICVAHNGFNFDFPIIRKTLDKVTSLGVPLLYEFLEQDGVYLCDSLIYFRCETLQKREPPQIGELAANFVSQ